MNLPYVGIHLKTINTFFHELGHALASLLSAGEIHHIKLNLNNSGEALTANKEWFSKFFVSISGYLFPLVLAIFLALFIHYHKTIIAVYSLVSISVAATIMWIRNTYGYVWCLLFIVLQSAIIYFDNLVFQKYFLIVVMQALLAENVNATITLLKLAYRNPKQAGDASSLKQLTLVPAILWSLLFIMASVITILLGLVI